MRTNVYTDYSDGAIESVADPYGDTTRYGYNNDMMVCWVAPPSVTTSGSECGSPTSTPTEAPTGSTAYQYDSYGDLACTFTAYGETDQETSYATYDPDGEMTASYSPNTFGSGASWGCSGAPSKF